MPEKIQRPNYSTIIRDAKLNLERQANRTNLNNKRNEDVELAKRSAETREKIRTTELNRKDELQKKVVEKKGEEVKENRRIEDRVNPRSGDIVNVVA